MGARCSPEPSPPEDGGGAGSAVAQPILSKDTRFWHEKMRFSKASQNLFDATVRGDAELAAKAVRELGDPNCCGSRGHRPLQIAVACGHRDIVGILLKAGADVNGFAEGTAPPIVLAAGCSEDKDAALFESLLANGGDLNLAEARTGETALTRAAVRGHLAVVRVILGRGTAGHQRLLAQRQRAGPEGDGSTALHLAAGKGFREICDRLLGVGADPVATDRSGRSPLHWAAEGNNVEVANILLTFGGKPSAQDKLGQSPLHVAADRGFLTLADLLLRYQADPNSKCRDGRVPVHLAAKGGHDILCLLLLAQRAEPNVADAAGETPFAMAFAEAHTRCCRALLEGGAEFRAVDLQRYEPPYTDFSPEEHSKLRKGRTPQDAETPRDLVGC